jgi:hypothetical protein
MPGILFSNFKQELGCLTSCPAGLNLDLLGQPGAPFGDADDPNVEMVRQSVRPPRSQPKAPQTRRAGGSRTAQCNKPGRTVLMVLQHY